MLSFCILLFAGFAKNGGGSNTAAKDLRLVFIEGVKRGSDRNRSEIRGAFGGVGKI